PNGYLGRAILFPSRVESNLDEEHVILLSTGSDSIWPDQIGSRLETWSLPSTPAMKLKLPKQKSRSGMKATRLMLNDAIKVVDGSSAPTVGVFLPAIVFMGQVVKSQA